MDKAAMKAAKRAAKAQRKASEPIPVFFCEPVGDYTVSNGFRCKGCGEYTRQRVEGRFAQDARPPFPEGATTPCPKCGEPMEAWSQSFDAIYRRHGSGEEVNPDGGKLPPGACWASRHPFREGPDGRELWVMLPDGHSWCIDSRASNCTMKDDEVHYCWVRTGRPEDGTLHVHKGKPGESCKAGAGSILTSKFHGFLHHGHLKAC